MIMSILPAYPGSPKSCLGICGKVADASFIHHDNTSDVKRLSKFMDNSTAIADFSSTVFRIKLTNIVPTPDWEDEVFAVGALGPRIHLQQVYPWLPHQQNWHHLNQMDYPVVRPACGAIVTEACGKLVTCLWLMLCCYEGPRGIFTEYDQIDTVKLCSRPQLFHELSLVVWPPSQVAVQGITSNSNQDAHALKELTFEMLSACPCFGQHSEWALEHRWRNLEACLLKTSAWKELMTAKDMTRMRTHCLPSISCSDVK